jgi:predicted AlkP superfamily phosphohydrolase/phosphomutase
MKPVDLHVRGCLTYIVWVMTQLGRDLLFVSAVLMLIEAGMFTITLHRASNLLGFRFVHARAPDADGSSSARREWRAAAAGKSGQPAGRTIVLGFDGMDPDLTERWMAKGLLPNFARLAKEGFYQRLPTTNPAQSPVAWSSFATGLNPGGHGLFDFIRRNPRTYAPEYSIATTEGPVRHLEIFGLRIPLDDAIVINRRVGRAFWMDAEQAGLRSSVLQVPATYPPDSIFRMLSGMGVPDLLGTQGTFTIYTTKQARGDQGRTVVVRPVNGRVESVLEGPPHPLYAKPEPLTLPLVVEAAGPEAVSVKLGGTSVKLKVGEWSDWVPLKYTIAWIIGLRGLVRLHLVQGFPELELYVSPIQFDPRAPVHPISSPPEFAKELASRIGLYHTIGMPEETWSLNEEWISDHAYLEMVKTILAEREAMFFDVLDRKDSQLVVIVFVQIDRVSHMFYRGLDTLHPLYAQTGEEERGAIEWIYREADRILGRTIEKMELHDRLVVLSDHGFKSFRRAVHLNRWLADQRFLALKPGKPVSPSLFTNVDWTRSKAYALGLNGLFINRKNREELGIVREEHVAELKKEIAEKLEKFIDADTGERVVLKVYDAAESYAGQQMEDAPDLLVGYAPGYRASWQTALGGVPEPLIEANRKKWSGDHCNDPVTVPGILFASFVPAEPVGSIADVPKVIRASFALASWAQNRKRRKVASLP